jgi:D-glycero-D-manno-heptose 1,7-bisphosphate phosphatase
MNKNRALLLDRDGVINADAGYIGSMERFSFLPGVFPFLRAARDLGYRLAIATNQAGVARGLYSADDYRHLTRYMLRELKRESIDIDLVLACFEHDKGVDPVFTRQSFWRKPQPGMVLEAIRRLDLDPLRSAFLGDALTDMRAAQDGGLRLCLWLTEEKVEAPAGIDVVRNYDEALEFLRVPFA